MFSGHQPATLDSHPIPIASPNTHHRDSLYPVPPRRSRLPTFHAGAEWNLEAPSDADLYDEQQSSPTLPRSDTASRCSPIPSTTTQDSPSISVSPAAMFLAAFSPSMKPTPQPDDEGQAVAGYTLGGIVGYGGFSIIRRAFSTSGGIVAVKIVRRSEIQKQANSSHTLKKLRHEAEVWGSLSHEHILPLFAAVHTSYADFFVTLFCPAGSLYDILQRDGTPSLLQDDAGMMFRQVVRGLRYLHEVAMYVHRDIKLENVLVDEMGVCRIGDFGMSRKIGELDEGDLESDVEEQSDHDSFDSLGNHGHSHRAATFSGSIHRSAQAPVRHSGTRHRNSTSTANFTPPSQTCQPGSLPYASPEILLPQTRGALRPSPAQDIWALGVLLHTLLTGQFPFWDSFEPRLQMKILQGTFEIPPGIGKGAERVLRGCLEKSTQQRWSISMVDEVAWGVGWGSEGDSVTPAESDDEYETHCPPSRSRSRPPNLVLSSPGADTLPDNGQSRHVREAASRRSASRAKRSRTRAPVPTRSRSRGVVSRHTSRAPSPSPTTSGLSGSIISESPFLSSPTSSIDRGRRLCRNVPSRSPSPSIIPGTPNDFSAPFRGPFSSSLPVVDDQVDELSLDAMHKEGEGRGRSVSARELGATPLSYSTSYGSSDNDNLDIVFRVGTRGNGYWGGEEITDRGVVVEDNRSDCNHHIIPEKERSRSCGHSLSASSTRESLITKTMRDSRRLSHYFEPYEYDHEYWTRTIRPDSSPESPNLPWSVGTTTRTPVSNAQSGRPPSFSTAINELLKKTNVSQTPPVSAPDIPGIARRERSMDCTIGWS